MKPILIALVMAVGAGGIYVAYERLQAPVSAQNEVKVETVEIAVDPLLKLISEAQEAHKADIEAQAKAAYDSAVSQALLDIEIEVREAYQAELEAETAEKKKQSVSY